MALADSSGVSISELQTGSVTSANDEFVELQNTSAADIALTGWTLQYRAASVANGSDCTKGWTNKLVLGGGAVLKGGHFLLASPSYLAPDITFNSGLAAAGGAVRLLDAVGTSVDAVAWGTGSCGTGAVAPAAEPGQSLELGAGGAYVVQASPTPQASGQPAVVVAGKGSVPASVDTPTPAPTTAATASPAAASDSADIELSELLPDPIAPLTDAHDEFIELYNNTAGSIDLTGYTLKVGNGNYVIKNVSIPADGYSVFTSATTKLSLVNSGSTVSLLGPDGAEIDATTYPKAQPGLAWAQVAGAWDWTTEPTSGADNVALPPVLASAAAGTATGSKKAAASLSKTTKAVAAKKPKTSAKDSAATTKTTQPLLATVGTPGGRWLLFVMASLTMGYIIYEFRYDLRTLYFKLRGYPNVSPVAVPAAPGRRNRRTAE